MHPNSFDELLTYLGGLGGLMYLGTIIGNTMRRLRNDIDEKRAIRAQAKANGTQ